MDYSRTYKKILNALCEAYKEMLGLLTLTERYDAAFMKLMEENRPDTKHIGNITSQKDRLIQQIDETMCYAEQLHIQLDHVMEFYQDVSYDPQYRRLEDLQILASARMRAVLFKEDINNPVIIQKLEDYKEALELDLKINEIPMSQRQIFMFVPDRKK